MTLPAGLRPRYAPMPREMGAELAPRAGALLRALARHADDLGRVQVSRAALAAETELDELGVELAVAVAVGRGFLRCRWADTIGDGEAVLVGRLTSRPEVES